MNKFVKKKEVRKCKECNVNLKEQKQNKSGYCSACGIRIRNKENYKKRKGDLLK